MVHCHRCLHWDWRAVFFCFDCCSCRFINHWYLHCLRYHGDVRGSDLVTMSLPYSTFQQHRIRSGTPLLLYGTRYPLLIVALVSYRYSVSNFEFSVLPSPLLTWPGDSLQSFRFLVLGHLVLFIVLNSSVKLPGNLQLSHVERFCRQTEIWRVILLHPSRLSLISWPV